MEAKTKIQFSDLSFARALIVDDIHSNQILAAGMVKKYKMQADCAGGGQEALNLIKSGKPVYNIVFMDNLMPGMDGIETATRIRALDTGYARNIPIIAVTGDETPDNEKLFLKNGFQAFIVKPLTFAKLDPVLKAWVREQL